MRAAVAAAALLFAIELPIPAMAQECSAPGIDAEAVFKAHCSTCHEPAIQRAPDREQLRARTVQDIFEALTIGVMQPMAQGLSANEMGALASLLGGRTAEGANAFVPRGVTDPAAEPAVRSAPANVAAALFAKLRAVTPAMLANPSPGEWLHWGRTMMRTTSARSRASTEKT